MPGEKQVMGTEWSDVIKWCPPPLAWSMTRTEIQLETKWVKFQLFWHPVFENTYIGDLCTLDSLLNLTDLKV